MRTLNRWILAIAIGAALAGPASAQSETKAPTPSPQADPEAEAKSRQELDRLLGAWQAKCRTFRTLAVRFERTDRSTAWGDRSYRGQALFRDPNSACVEFRKPALDAEGKPTDRFADQPHERLVFTGDTLAQYDYDDRILLVLPPRSPFSESLFRPGSLPFMFLFRINAAEIQERYQITLLQRSPSEALIRLRPRRPADRMMCEQALLWLDLETSLPDRVRLYGVGGKTSQDFKFSGDKLGFDPNRPLHPSYFEVIHPPGWRTGRAPDFSGLLALDPAVRAIVRFFNPPRPDPAGPPR